MRVSTFSATAATLATTLLLASVASAATVVGAKSIHITKGGGVTDYIQISEVVALDFGSLDVALASNGGSATALNIYSVSHIADRAIDGIFPTLDAFVYISAGTASDYLDITFASATTLSSLAIYGRPACCSDRDVFHADILDANGKSLYSGVFDANNGDHFASAVFDRPTDGVPEPEVWALMLAGFGGIGAAMRRRRVGLNFA